MLAANLTGLHPLNIRQINENTLILTIEFFLNNLPQSLSRNVGDNVVSRIITGWLVLYQLKGLLILTRLTRTHFVSYNTMHTHL